jgi:hypothetical protein
MPIKKGRDESRPKYSIHFTDSAHTFIKPNQTTPWASMALATLMNPATLAPLT